MHRILKAFRYLVFGLFVICNAIIASVGVWNLSTIQSLGWKLSSTQIDSYLIFLGATGLVLIFPIIFLELFDRNVVLCRVWFECIWVGLYWIMELVGAVALTSISHDQLCNNPIDSASPLSECTSAQVLQAFTWICTLFLMSYFFLLLITTLVKYRKDATIWHCAARRFPWFGTRTALASAPSSPAVAKFKTTAPVIVAPQPRRATMPREPIYSYRSGLSLEYEIEHYQPPSTGGVGQLSHPAPAAFPGQRIRTSREGLDNMVATSFYPHYMQPALLPQPDRGQIPIRRVQSSPPPLGDWPRLDATSRPSHSKRKPPPISSPATTSEAPNPQVALPPISSSFPRSRPSGPRRRSNSGEDNRPPQLDLSNISTFHTRGYS